VREADEPYRSTLMGFLEGNSDVLDDLVAESTPAACPPAMSKTPSATPPGSC
jgi:hypothetical protein